MHDEINETQELSATESVNTMVRSDNGDVQDTNLLASLPSSFWDNLSVFLSLFGIKEDTVSNATGIILQVWPVFSEQLPTLLDHFEGDLTNIGDTIRFFCSEKVLKVVSTSIQTVTGVDMGDVLDSCASVVSAAIPLFTTFVSNGSIGKALATLKGVLNVH